MRTISFDLPSLHRIAVGFDRQFDDLLRYANSVSAEQKYPPHNIIQFNETDYAIEFAVAGFNENELTVELTKGVLTVTGQKAEASADAELGEYLHKGIGTRNFVRQIPLAENFKVQGASVKNGILIISIKHIVPEADLPKKIAISFLK